MMHGETNMIATFSWTIARRKAAAEQTLLGANYLLYCNVVDVRHLLSRIHTKRGFPSPSPGTATVVTVKETVQTPIERIASSSSC